MGKEINWRAYSEATLMKMLELFQKSTGYSLLKLGRASDIMMSQSQKPKKNPRTVLAPPPTNPSIPPSIYGVELEEGLDVEWHWLELPDGNKVVTRYRIIASKINSF